jgi:hypothetical protein
VAVSQPVWVDPRLSEIVDAVAHGVARHGVGPGDASSAKAVLRIELEDNVKRIVQVYWTGFEANIPGQCIGLHLEVAQPKVHWAEAYLSLDAQNWIFCFHERGDGEMQLAHYRQLATPAEAIDSFFDLATWYVLTATDLTWDDVVYEVSPHLDWRESRQNLAGTSASPAVQEALKKSTIIWLRWGRRGAPGEQTMPVWFVYDQKVGKIYVLSGERQQTIPDAARLRETDVIFRWKGKNARVAELPASVRVLPQGPEWDQVAEKIAEKRLNIPGLPEETARRWRDECDILELTLRS